MMNKKSYEVFLQFVIYCQLLMMFCKCSKMHYPMACAIMETFKISLDLVNTM